MAGDRKVGDGDAVHRTGPPARIYLSNAPREAHRRDRAETHARWRAKQRHGLKLDAETRSTAEHEIRVALRRWKKEKTGRRLLGPESTAGIIERVGAGRLSCVVMIDGAMRYVIYDEGLRRIVTVLPGAPR